MFVEDERDAQRRQQREELIESRRSMAVSSSYERQKIIFSSKSDWQTLLRNSVSAGDLSLPALRPRTANASSSSLLETPAARPYASRGSSRGSL